MMSLRDEEESTKETEKEQPTAGRKPGEPAMWVLSVQLCQYVKIQTEFIRLVTPRSLKILQGKKKKKEAVFSRVVGVKAYWNRFEKEWEKN